jgi:hypothetical protein
VPLAAGLVAALAERDAPSGQAVGYWIGLMSLPTLIAFAAVRFKPAQRMRTFSTVFCCVGLFGLASMLGSMHDLFVPKKTIQEIVREAAGAKPVTESGTPSEQKADRVMREFMADVLAARKKHDSDLAPIEPVLGTIYSAPSFSSRKQMEDMVAALKSMLNVDGELLDKFQRLPQEVKARVDASDLDPSVKKDLMRGFEQGYGNSGILTAYQKVRTNEEQWVDTSIDLYTFALQHASNIKTTDKKILISGGSLLSQFNVKFKASRDLRTQVDAANQELVALQAVAMRETGISKSDLGLK